MAKKVPNPEILRGEEPPLWGQLEAALRGSTIAPSMFGGSLTETPSVPRTPGGVTYEQMRLDAEADVQLRLATRLAELQAKPGSITANIEEGAIRSGRPAQAVSGVPEAGDFRSLQSPTKIVNQAALQAELASKPPAPAQGKLGGVGPGLAALSTFFGNMGELGASEGSALSAWKEQERVRNYEPALVPLAPQVIGQIQLDPRQAKWLTDKKFADGWANMQAQGGDDGKNLDYAIMAVKAKAGDPGATNELTALFGFVPDPEDLMGLANVNAHLNQHETMQVPGLTIPVQSKPIEVPGLNVQVPKQKPQQKPKNKKKGR